MPQLFFSKSLLMLIVRAMDPRACDAAHLLLHLTSFLWSPCPSCVCKCPAQTVSRELSNALAFCHNIANSCEKGGSSSYSFSLFWLRFLAGITVCVTCRFFLESCRNAWAKLTIRGTGGRSITPPRAAIAESSTAEPANPRRLRELGLYRD